MNNTNSDIYEILDTLSLPVAAQRFSELTQSPELGNYTAFQFIRDDLGTSTLFSCQYSPDEWGKQLSDENECYGKLDGIRRRLATGFTVLIEKA